MLQLSCSGDGRPMPTASTRLSRPHVSVPLRFVAGFVKFLKRLRQGQHVRFAAASSLF